MSENYWREMYGPRTKDFIDGVIAGVTAYAVWKDGKEVVGIRERPLEEVVAEIKEGLS